MTKLTNALGADGERVAEQALREAGMTVLDRNWRCGRGEIDIVARDGPTIVFCEVKTRRSATFGAPSEAVTAAKVRRLRVLAAMWLAEHPETRGEVRFDVVSVRPQGTGDAALEHLRGAF